LKIEQLLYLQIFIFYRKFESNLKIFASCISVIISNFGQPLKATSRSLPVAFGHLLGAPDIIFYFDVAVACHFSVQPPRYKAQRAGRRVPFLLLCSVVAPASLLRRSPPLPLCHFQPSYRHHCIRLAPTHMHRSLTPFNFTRSHQAPLSSSPTEPSAAGTALAVASSICHLFASTEHSSRSRASHWCSPTSLIHLFCLAMADAPPPLHRFRHGRWQAAVPLQYTLLSYWLGSWQCPERVEPSTSPKTSPSVSGTGQPPRGHGFGRRSEQEDDLALLGRASKLGQKEKERSGLGVEFSLYSFLKILNSTEFCLFHCEISRAPKNIENFCVTSL
jgi:hypothetical protein